MDKLIYKWEHCIRWEDCIEPPPACPNCGSLLLWRGTGSDVWRCQRCDPPIVAQEAAKRAATIRHRSGSAAITELMQEAKTIVPEPNDLPF